MKYFYHHLKTPYSKSIHLLAIQRPPSISKLFRHSGWPQKVLHNKTFYTFATTITLVLMSQFENFNCKQKQREGFKHFDSKMLIALKILSTGYILNFTFGHKRVLSRYLRGVVLGCYNLKLSSINYNLNIFISTVKPCNGRR